jgi:hypothetical protein
MSWACRSRGLLRPCRVHRRWIEQGIDVLLYGRSVEPGVLPQPVRNRRGVDAGGRPPRRLVAMPVKGPMMGAAERDRKLIAHPATQSLGLHESEVTGIAGLPPTNQSRLRRHELKVSTVAIAAWLAQRKRALVDMANNGFGWRTEYTH